MSPVADTHAIRTAVALSRMDHVVPLRLSGPDAYDALDWLCPQELFVRDGRMLHTLLLDESARPLVDLYVCCDDEDFVLLCDGMAADRLEAHVRDNLPTGARVELRVQADELRMMSLHGPYAWELLGEIVGPDVIGLPYMTFFAIDGGVCHRAGKTGEYGYDLLLARDRADALEARIREIGVRFGLCDVDLAALDQCALENAFFNPRREGSHGLGPLELQLQWRVSYRKRFLGADALAARRAEGIAARSTWILAPARLDTGDPVTYRGETIGRILAAGWSMILDAQVAIALLDLDHAHPGIGAYRAGPADRDTEIVTVSPPVLENRSLHIDVQRHSWQSRPDDAFPSIRPELPWCR